MRFLRRATCTGIGLLFGSSLFKVVRRPRVRQRHGAKNASWLDRLFSSARCGMVARPNDRCDAVCMLERNSRLFVRVHSYLTLPREWLTCRAANETGEISRSGTHSEERTRCFDPRDFHLEGAQQAANRYWHILSWSIILSWHTHWFIEGRESDWIIQFLYIDQC